MGFNEDEGYSATATLLVNQDNAKQVRRYIQDRIYGNYCGDKNKIFTCDEVKKELEGIILKLESKFGID